MIIPILYSIALAAGICEVEGAVLSLRQKPTNTNSTTFQFGSTDTPMRGVNAGGW